MRWPWKRKRARLAWGQPPVAWPEPGPPLPPGSLIVHVSDVDVLARYNAERARGILHTWEWQEKMAELQRQHDAARKEWRP